MSQITFHRSRAASHFLVTISHTSTVSETHLASHTSVSPAQLHNSLPAASHKTTPTRTNQRPTGWLTDARRRKGATRQHAFFVSLQCDGLQARTGQAHKVLLHRNLLAPCCLNTHMLCVLTAARSRGAGCAATSASAQPARALTPAVLKAPQPPGAPKAVHQAPSPSPHPRLSVAAAGRCSCGCRLHEQQRQRTCSKTRTSTAQHGTARQRHGGSEGVRERLPLAARLHKLGQVICCLSCDLTSRTAACTHRHTALRCPQLHCVALI
jgi:hypothetical protein